MARLVRVPLFVASTVGMSWLNLITAFATLISAS